jgi:hypothetical protein
MRRPSWAWPGSMISYKWRSAESAIGSSSSRSGACKLTSITRMASFSCWWLRSSSTVANSARDVSEQSKARQMRRMGISAGDEGGNRYRRKHARWMVPAQSRRWSFRACAACPQHVDILCAAKAYFGGATQKRVLVPRIRMWSATGTGAAMMVSPMGFSESSLNSGSICAT